MSSLLAKAVRLVKIGAVAGAAVGLGRLVLQHRRRSQVDESSWPTIAETAARNGQPVDDQPDEDAGDTAAADGGSDSAEDADKD